MPKESYTEVIPGTKKYELLQILLTDRGITSFEASHLYSSQMFRQYIESLIDMNGYDIRAFPTTDSRRRKYHKPKYILAWRCIGRYSWDSGYTDYTKGLQDSL